LPPARFLGDRFDARQCVFKERQSNAIVICGMWSHWTRGTDVAMVKLDCRFAKQFCGCVIQRLIFGKGFTHKKSNRQGCCLDGNHQRKVGSNVILTMPFTCMDVLTIEALACRDGLILEKKIGTTRVLLETDCQELVLVSITSACKMNVFTQVWENLMITQTFLLIPQSLPIFPPFFPTKGLTEVVHPTIA